MWYHEHIGGGHCPIVDTWWQTETGMVLISPLPGVTTTKPGSATKPFPGVEAAVLNEQGERVEQRRRLPRARAALARDDARHLRRRRALPRDVLVALPGALLRRRRRPDRRRRRLLAARPRRRRDERLRPPALDDRGRVGARRPSAGRRGRRLRPLRRDDGPGDRRLRDAEGQRGPVRRDARGAPQPRREQDRRDREAGQHRLHARSCRRPARARSCAACCATWPRTGRSATPRRSPIPRSSTSSPSAPRRTQPRTRRRRQAEAARAKASSVRRTSSASVRQHETEMRIAAWPSQTVGLIHASPSCCTAATIARVRSSFSKRSST